MGWLKTNENSDDHGFEYVTLHEHFASKYKEVEKVARQYSDYHYEAVSESCRMAIEAAIKKNDENGYEEYITETSGSPAFADLMNAKHNARRHLEACMDYKANVLSKMGNVRMALNALADALMATTEYEKEWASPECK